MGLRHHDGEQLGKDGRRAKGIGVGQRRALRGDGAQVIEPAFVALHRRHDVTQARGPGELPMQKGHELALGRQGAHVPIAAVLLHTSLEGAPRNELQNVVKEAILVPHGAGLLPCSTMPASSRITEESAPCALSIKTQPDSREHGFAMTPA
jgi:hypothetical protein